MILSCYCDRTPVDRDYSKMTEQDCGQMVTHYAGNSFGRLNDIAIGPNGEVVMVDYGSRCVVVLDNKLNLLKMIDQETGDNLLANPNGVAVCDNIIAVSDYGSHQVKNYSWQGELLSVIGCYGPRNGQFKYPRGLAFSDNKVLYVVDGENFRIQVFQQDTFAFLFGSRESGPGQFQCPVRIAIDPVKNNVLVTDISANCIHLFSDSGRFIQAIDCHDPWAIAISPTGYLITGHYGGDHKILLWSPEYQLIKQFGKKGSKQGEFCGVIGMAMDTYGAIYIVEYFNKRLQVIL